MNLPSGVQASIDNLNAQISELIRMRDFVITVRDGTFTDLGLWDFMDPDLKDTYRNNVSAALVGARDNISDFITDITDVLP